MSVVSCQTRLRSPNYVTVLRTVFLVYWTAPCSARVCFDERRGVLCQTRLRSPNYVTVLRTVFLVYWTAPCSARVCFDERRIVSNPPQDDLYGSGLTLAHLRCSAQMLRLQNTDQLINIVVSKHRASQTRGNKSRRKENSVVLCHRLRTQEFVIVRYFVVRKVTSRGAERKQPKSTRGKKSCYRPGRQLVPEVVFSRVELYTEVVSVSFRVVSRSSFTRVIAEVPRQQQQR
ncbi:hypothetical protein RRG08_047750 [Elysia crispata]|uniref:Uncharacterized protein n=1 Tax=Elysia crispata TaxID=231223 RepID=A0AAE1A4J0_9GAST|nr:hypothetical protein RRG08_047750 [Elysia crispata]